jgi:hypothetical protein
MKLIMETYYENIVGKIQNPLQSYTNIVKVKVKCTLVQALRLCTGRTAHRASRGIDLLYRH